MFNRHVFNEAQIHSIFGKPIALRLKCLTGDGQAVFDEFKFKDQCYLGGYDRAHQCYYILNTDAATSRICA